MAYRDLTPELSFQATRSSGAGGQHVNKVSTRAEVRFNILQSELLTAEEKQILMEKLGSRLTREGELIVTSDETRSQLRNRQDATLRLHNIVFTALTPRKKRIKTKTPNAARLKRLEQKKAQSKKKQLRKPPE